MKNLILFENFANEASVSRAKPGDLVETRSGTYLVLSEPKIGRSWNEYSVIHSSEIEKSLKNPKEISVATWKVKQGSYLNVTGTVPKAKLLKLKEAYDKKHNEIETHNSKFVADKYKENSPSVNFKSNSSRYNDGGFEVTMVDGNTAKVGDVVEVKFSNGLFDGTIKAVAGRKDGAVTISFRGKKGRAIAPKNILRKISR